MASHKWEVNRRSIWRKKCEGYFARCDQEGRRYTVAGLRLALDADGEKWDRLRQDPVLKDIIGWALDKIRDALEQREDQMAVAQLRQPEFSVQRSGKGPVAMDLQVTFGDGGGVEEYGG